MGDSWSTSDRRAHLPSNWSSLTKRILERDPTCQLAYPGEWRSSRGVERCDVVSSEVDHAGDRDDHRPHMLRGVCSPCHRRRTREQQAEVLAKARMPAERHPGLM